MGEVRARKRALRKGLRRACAPKNKLGLKPGFPMKNLREARIRAGLSQEELAAKVGVTQPTVSNWERAKGVPSAEQEKFLGTVLDLGSSANGTVDASPLAAWLTKARSAKGWSIPELAHKAGLTPPAVYRIESGVTRNLREATRNKLEGVLGPVPSETAAEVAEEAEIQGLGKLEDFDPHADNERPTDPGIYVFYDISERPIYVGEGKNVRKRIRDHEEKFWFKRPIVESASWIKVEDDTLRTQIETLLVKFLKSNAVINKQNVDRG
jgi:transcriptional regulator with XRE-family HTH domain